MQFGKRLVLALVGACLFFTGGCQGNTNASSSSAPSSYVSPPAATGPTLVYNPPRKSVRFVNLIRLPTYRASNALLIREPMGLVFGPDDALWYADARGEAIVKIQHNGRATILSQGKRSPLTLAVGDDESIWYTLIGQPEIDRLTPSGRRITYPLPLGKLPDSIVRGSNGAMWFISAENQIGRRSSDGTFQFYNVQMDRRAPSPDGFGVLDRDARYLSQLVATSDGSVWVLLLWMPSVGIQHSLIRISAGGRIREFTTPTEPPIKDPLVVSPDGSIWFWSDADPTSPYVGFLDAARHFHVFKTPSGPGPLTIDKNGVAWGLIWSRLSSGGGEAKALAKITPAGTIAEFSTPDDQPIDFLFNGWGGDLWAETVDKQGNKVFAQVVAEP